MWGPAGLTHRLSPEPTANPLPDVGEGVEPANKLLRRSVMPSRLRRKATTDSNAVPYWNQTCAEAGCLGIGGRPGCRGLGQGPTFTVSGGRGPGHHSNSEKSEHVWTKEAKKIAQNSRDAGIITWGNEHRQ